MTSRPIFLLLFLCLFCSKTAANQEFFPFLAEVLENNVNVRAGQSENFEKLCQLQKGEEVVVVERSYSWYKIRLPLKANSFISGKYVRLLEDDIGEVVANRVNLRAGAGVAYSTLGQVNAGEKVKILQEKDGWYKIEPGKESSGWILDKFLAFKAKDLPEELLPKEKADLQLTTKIDEEPIQEEQANIQNVTVTGYLKPRPYDIEDHIQYQLKLDNKNIYFVDGLKHILKEFSHQKVTIEGMIETDEADKYLYPVISVSKIQLVL